MPAIKTATKTKAKAKVMVADKRTPKVGDKVPGFSMPATIVGKVDIAWIKGRPAIIYFYPKDDTSGCTAEACNFRDSIASFKKLGVPVIGVSKDSIKSHEKFATKYALNFPLGSDEDGSACAAFGVWVEKSMYGKKYMGIERSTFLIDPKGVVRGVWRKVSVTVHVDDVKTAIENL